jgi:hypothetical protein
VLTIAVTQDVTIKKKRCDCGEDKLDKREACRYTVLESESSKRPFPLRKMSVPGDKPTTWNLALLGLPQHPDFNDTFEKVKDVKWLSIELNPEGKPMYSYAGRTQAKILQDDDNFRKPCKSLSRFVTSLRKSTRLRKD